MKIKKEKIISEIQRVAKQNNGEPLGMDLFKKETGIKKEDWYGIYWAKWSDAIVEAGFKPKSFGTPAYEENWMLEKICNLARELGRFPSKPEIKLRRQIDTEFPHDHTILKQIGPRKTVIKKVIEFCTGRPEYGDVLSICTSIQGLKEEQENADLEIEQASEIGHVYLLKHESVYKIGRSNDAAKRYKDIRVQMPYVTEEIHVIETDDPPGIEAYWHNRFKEKRLEGEWFKLSAQDVRTFKKRRFM